MRIFYAFLIIFTATFLWLLPVTTSIYDFRTDLRTDTYTSTTAVATTTANVVLGKPIYDNDTGTLSFISDNSADTPIYFAYDTPTRELEISGLSANSTRIIEVSYDISSLTANPSVETLLDALPFIWIIIIIAFGPAALFAIFTGRA